jgi:hypothetical protein
METDRIAVETEETAGNAIEAEGAESDRKSTAR